MDELLRELPPVGRMRAWRLYARNGDRFLDLRFLDGAGFIGAKGRLAGTWAKNALDRALLKPAPDAYQGRLERELAKKGGEGARAFLFRDCEKALAAWSRAAAAEIRRESLFDPALRSTVAPQDAPGAVDRPFAGGAALMALAAAPVLLCPPALPGPLGCAGLVVRAGRGESEAGLAARIKGEVLEGVSTFPSQRALDDRELMARDYSDALYRKVDRRLAPFFERRGPFLYARVEGAEAYAAFRRKALEGGALLSAGFEEPSIVPLDVDDGELAKLAKALA
ncbi:MAG: hypothetical protein JXA15_03090 [Spirochaetales bacterium]|nr:hypothetical protein [Spirochaetales bacterium]